MKYKPVPSDGVLPPGLGLFEGPMKPWSGFTLTGWRPMGAPVNSGGALGW